VRRVGIGLTALALAGCAGGCGGGGGSSTTSAGGGPAGAATGSASTAGPGPPTATGPRPAAPTVRLAAGIRFSSPAFRAGGAIPAQYTCDGSDISLPLRWSRVPPGTRELLLVMRDPDATTGNFIHWAVAGIAAASGSLQAGRSPAGTVEGRNSFGSVGYRGPCPPPGGRPHHYVLTLSAFAARSDLTAGFNPDRVRIGALAFGTLIGTYARR
jgi:Raf kinase inhibitor-like YbhB/YbcL family protein